jgi:pentatricopeptide repeat protein
MIIPIGDDNPREKFPIVTYGLIGINTIVYIYFGWIHGNYQDIINRFGFIPGQFNILTLFTSMFLHADIFHLVGNMLYLWIYGDNVEAKFGKVRFLLFYLASGVVGHALQTAISTDLQVPNIGASGAIAGVLGAYLVLFPTANINFWYGFFFYFRLYSGKFKLPAWLVLGGWFALQLIYGYIGLSGKLRLEGGIAFFAHIGGFLCGAGVMLLFRELYRMQRSRLLSPVLDELDPPRVSYDSDQKEGIHNYQKTIKKVLLEQGTGEAVPLYERMQSQYPDSAVDHETAFQIAESYCRRKEFDKALATYKKMLVHDPSSDKADNALWCMAEIYNQPHYLLTEKADQCLQIIIDAYPLSEWYLPAMQVLEQEGKDNMKRPRLETITRLGFAGRQLQFTGPVLVGILVSVGTINWMSATLSHRPGDLFGSKSAIAIIKDTATPAWLDNFDSGDLSQWTIKYPEDKTVKLAQDNSISAPNSLRFSRDQTPPGLINPAIINSKIIPIYFDEPYTLSFDMFYTGAFIVQQIEFGHISIDLQIVRVPMMGTNAQMRYKFGHETRPIRLDKKPLGKYLPAKQWNQLALTISPQQKTLTISINQQEWTTVALDMPNLEPRPKIKFSNTLTTQPQNDKEATIVYLDNIAVYGKKIAVLEIAKPIEKKPQKVEAKLVEPDKSVSELPPPATPAPLSFIEIYQLGWKQLNQGEYYAAVTSFQQAANMNPRSPDVHNALGLAYRKAGNEEQAIQEFKLALEIDPNYSPAKENIKKQTAETQSLPR